MRERKRCEKLAQERFLLAFPIKKKEWHTVATCLDAKSARNMFAGCAWSATTVVSAVRPLIGQLTSLGARAMAIVTLKVQMLQSAKAASLVSVAAPPPRRLRPPPLPARLALRSMTNSGNARFSLKRPAQWTSSLWRDGFTKTLADVSRRSVAHAIFGQKTRPNLAQKESRS